MSQWKTKIEDHIYDLKKMWKVRDEQAECFSGRIKALTGRVDRLERELVTTREALDCKAHRAEQLIASHEGIEHEGLNRGLVEALIFDQGMDPYSALHLLRENKGKS